MDETYSRLDKEDVFTTPKTENSDRVVYLPPDTMNILKDYLDRHPDIQGNDRIFPYVHRTVEKAFARDIDKSEVKYITVHCLRHSHCAYLMSLGKVDMNVISERLGHKDATITSRVYAHVYDKTAMNVAQIMQDNINGRKTS